MRQPLAAAKPPFLRRMLRSLSTLWPSHNFLIGQVISPFSFFPSILQFSTSSIQLPPNLGNLHLNLSAINFISVKNHIFLKYPHLRNKEFDHFSKHLFKDSIFRLSTTNPEIRGKKNKFFSNPSLRDCIFRLSTINPEIIRKFRRVTDFKPEDVHEILLGFESKCEKFEIEVEKVKSLWSLFKLASVNARFFEHFPKSYELMASMLVRVGLLREVEYLLSTMDSKGVLLDSGEIFSNLLEGYVKEGKIDKAILVYDGMKAQGLVPSTPCYCALINFLIEKGDTHMSFRILTEMVKTDIGLSGDETAVFENVIRLLCRDGKVQEARNLVRRIVISGIRPSDLVLNEIASGYCEKKDYDDLLKFFAEIKCALNLLLGNKVIHSLCGSFGVERASLFLQEMKNIGFIPNEVTYGILIGWSCREHKLKNAFVYLSEVLSRSLKPDVRSYNTLISGVFREGMWKHGRDILYEMDDRGVIPNLGTFKVLLAGYSKARQFDEVKELIGEMVRRGFVNLSFLEDPLAKAFTLLGLDPLSVKLRRDNDVGLFKTEFYDKIGNGLYLETDITTFEKILNGVLNDLLVPDFNSLILENCEERNFRNAIIIVKEMIEWGQELSFSAFSELVKGLCTQRFSMKTVVSLVEKFPCFANQLDQETLNMLVQALSTKGFLNKATTIFKDMSKRDLEINSETCDALMTGLCRKRNLTSFLNCINFAKLNKWSPKSEDCNLIFSYLSEEGLVNEAFELFESTFLANPSKRLQIFHDFLEALCTTGLESVAHILVEELQNQGFALDSTTQNAIVEGGLDQNKPKKAVSSLNRMTEKSLIPDNINYDSEIKRLCQNEKLDKAIDLLNIMLKKVIIPSPSTYDELVQCFSKLLKLDEALDLLYEMLDMNLTPSAKTWDVIIYHVCQSGRTIEGENLLNLMVRIGEKPTREIYCSLIDRYYYEKNLIKASEFLQKMQQDGYEPDFGTHWSIISNLKNKTDENSGKSGRSFLSRLLSDSGFSPKKDYKAKLR